jgi:hypothetical protein
MKTGEISTDRSMLQQYAQHRSNQVPLSFLLLRATPKSFDSDQIVEFDRPSSSDSARAAVEQIFVVCAQHLTVCGLFFKIGSSSVNGFYA